MSWWHPPMNHLLIYDIVVTGGIDSIDGIVLVSLGDLGTRAPVVGNRNNVKDIDFTIRQTLW